MYSYYLLSGLGPEYQKYLWWKKYLTLLQLVQFAILSTHSAYGLFFGTCSYPKFILTLLVVNQFNFIIQFGRFYIRTYQSEKKQKQQKAA
ncbi:Elongation of very long chain fatty acids protein [Gryllus bimaculatus]|nr:Elongation of very long chain fatty acids protein [Gryllus bimaculatus]